MPADLTRTAEWTEDTIISLLASGQSWLNGVPPGTVRKVIRTGRVVSFRPGEHLADRLEHLKDVVIVLDGVLRVSSISLDGREHLIGLLEPGAIFGLLAAIDGGVSPHGATADGDMTAFLLGQADFRALMEEHPEFRDAIQGIICDRLRMAFSVLDQFAIGSPRARLAQRLLALGTSYGRRCKDGVEIDLHLTQDSLAAMIGLSRQRTNLILKNFEAEGLIQLSYGKVLLTNFEVLNQVVQDLG